MHRGGGGAAEGSADNHRVCGVSAAATMVCAPPPRPAFAPEAATRSLWWSHPKLLTRKRPQGCGPGGGGNGSERDGPETGSVRATGEGFAVTDPSWAGSSPGCETGARLQNRAGAAAAISRRGAALEPTTGALECGRTRFCIMCGLHSSVEPSSDHSPPASFLLQTAHLRHSRWKIILCVAMRSAM